MKFESGHLYHIYNQGNNRQNIFFKRDHYLFFFQKLRTFIFPFCDVLAYSLMPNHFHLMVLVNTVKLSLPGNSSDDWESSDEGKAGSLKERTLNHSIAIMLRSYTRALQKQEGFSGALFRQKTKAECLTNTEGITPSFINTKSGTYIKVEDAEKQYPQICFNYIHNNPVKANLVEIITDWEFSSARDYAGLRKGTLINMEIAKKYIKFDS